MAESENEAPKHQITPEAPVHPAYLVCGLPTLEASLPGHRADAPESHAVLSIPFAVWLPFCFVASAAMDSHLPRKLSCPNKPLIE